MKSLWVEKSILYDGSQLRRMFAYENYQLLGNSIVSFRGKCDVAKKNIKDGEDLFAGETIYSEDMLHFLIECHDTPLETMVTYQRLFTSIIRDNLDKKTGSSEVFRREGDDIYRGDAKLSISIATANSLSAMIHCGLNISSQNTPIKTIGLQDLGIDSIEEFSKNIMDLWLIEYQGIQEAKSKVFSL